MGQTLAVDLGLQKNEEQLEKQEKIQKIVNDLMKGKSNTNQSMSMQRSRFMSQDAEDDEDEEDLEDEEEDDEDEISIDDSYTNQQHKKGVVSSDSSRIESNQQSHHTSQNPIKADPNNQYQRPFQSIKIDKLYTTHDEYNEVEEHEQDMLNDITDEEDEVNDNTQQNTKTLSKQNSKKVHNIRDGDTNNLGSAQSQQGRYTDGQNPQIKFQSFFNKDFDFTLQSESEQSQFGAVFSSDSEGEQTGHKDRQDRQDRIRFSHMDPQGKEDLDKSKLADDDTKQSKSPPTKVPLVRGTSSKSKPSQKVNGKSQNHFFPTHSKSHQQETVKKDYEKYLTEFFPDRKSQRPDM